MTQSGTSSVVQFADLAAVRGMLADRQPVPMVSRKKSPDPGIPRNGEEPGEASPNNPKGWQPTSLGLPQGCPVHPLGIIAGNAYFLDPIGQIQMLAPPYGKGHLLGLFCGDENFLAWAWPRYKAGGGIDGYAAEKAAARLVGACAAKGPWNGVDTVRGRGAWTARNGSLVLHRGTKVLAGGRDQPPGEIEGFIYPTRPRLDGPWPGDSEDYVKPMRLLKSLLATWNWSRPDVDPTLLLGWIGAAFIGGALAWRPTVYLTGDAATGKSTLQELVKGLLGEYLLQATDTTAAGLYQHIGTDAVPIAVDEFEGKSDTRAAEKVLELARQSCSGGLMLRGGDRHNPVEFRARSCFLFSSINTPPLRPQDLSRMAVLRLAKLRQQSPEQVAELREALEPEQLRLMGRIILRRMIDEWHRYRETLLAFKGALAAGGMDSRGQDTFGTLLACADMIQHVGWDDMRLATPSSADEGEMIAWADLMRVDRMHEFEDRAANWRKCLSHMLGVRVDAWRSGSRAVVGQLLEDFYHHREGATDSKLVRGALGQAGLGLVYRREKTGAQSRWLAVPNQSPLVRELFNGSDWGGAVGASVWAGALRQSPRHSEAEPGIHDVDKARVNGDVTPCTLIRLDALYGPGGIMWRAEDEEQD